MQIDHGMHCRALFFFSDYFFGYRRKGGNLFPCSVARARACGLPIGAQRHMAVQLQRPDSAI